MKISVVIPAYNEENYIGECLQSLQSQTVKPDEIIVVDNNCTDDTAAIARKYGVRVVKENEKGVIFARNKGYDSANGDIIARTDADSRPPKKWISEIKKQFAENDIDCISGPVIIYDLPFPSPFWSNALMTTYMTLAGGRNLIVGPNHALTKEMWVKIRDQVCTDETKVHEDYDIALTVQKNGGTVMYDNDLIVLISGRRIKKNPLSFFIEYPLRTVKTLDHHHILPISLPH